MSVYCIVNARQKLHDTTRKIFLNEPLMYNNSLAHCFRLTLTADNGTDPADLTGVTATANFLRPDRGTVAITDTIEIRDNVIDVILPAACYSSVGRYKLTVDIGEGTGSSAATRTALIVEGITERNTTDTPVDPGTIMPSINTLISEINDAVDSIPADYTTLLGTIAPTFSSASDYKAGEYVWHGDLEDGGNLYQFTADHPAGNWTGTDVVEAVITDAVEKSVSREENGPDCLYPMIFGDDSDWTVVPSGTTHTGATCTKKGRRFTFGGASGSSNTTFFWYNLSGSVHRGFTGGGTNYSDALANIKANGDGDFVTIWPRLSGMSTRENPMYAVVNLYADYTRVGSASNSSYLSIGLVFRRANAEAEGGYDYSGMTVLSAVSDSTKVATDYLATSSHYQLAHNSLWSEYDQVAAYLFRRSAYTTGTLVLEPVCMGEPSGEYPGTVRYDTEQTISANGQRQARSNIQAAAQAHVGVEELAWSGSGSIDNSGTVGSAVDMTVVSGNNYRYMVVTCSPGDQFTITGAIGYTRCLYSFLDSNNVLLSSDGAGADRRNYVVTAPAGAAKLIAQCCNDKYGTFGVVYKGVLVPGTIAGMASVGHQRTPTISWENGGIDSTGFTSGATNKRSDGLSFNPGEKLVITNTSKVADIAIYATKDGLFRMVGSGGFVQGGGSYVLQDWEWVYYIRLRPSSGSARPDPESGGYISAVIESANPPYSKGYYRRCSYPQIGIHRTYTNIKPVLTFEAKTITDEGISDSSTSCLVTLPKCGWVEVKQDANSVQFKIAKVTDGVITFPVDEWSYYSYRYWGDGASDYYALVTKSPGASASSDIMVLTRKYLAVYLFTDEGAAYEHGYFLSGKHLAFIGDSITQGRFDKDGDVDHALETTTSKSFCELVAEMAGDDDVGNFGIGGAYVSGDNWKSLLSNCGKVSGYDVVFVCGGTNDYGNNVAEATFRTDYATVVDTLLAANTSVICCTPVYRTSKTGANTAGLWLSDYAAIIREIAAAKGCKCIDLMSLTGDGCFIRFCPDGLHPNEMGHKVMADWIVQECDRLGLT